MNTGHKRSTPKHLPNSGCCSINRETASHGIAQQFPRDCHTLESRLQPETNSTRTQPSILHSHPAPATNRLDCGQEQHHPSPPLCPAQFRQPSIVAAHYASLRHSPAFPKPIPAICSDEPRSGSEHHCLHPSRHWLWRTPTLAPTRHKPVGVPSFKSDVVTHHHQPSAPTIPIALRQAHSQAIPDSVMELDSPPAPRHSVKAQSPSELPAKESLGDIVDGQHQGKGAPLAKRGLGRPHACTFSARRFYPGKTSPVGRQPPPVIFKRGYAQKKSIPEYTSKLVLFNHNGILASVPTPDCLSQITIAPCPASVLL